MKGTLKNMTQSRQILSALALSFGTFVPLHGVCAELDLAGGWGFQLDATNTGVKEHWFTRRLFE